MDCGIMGLVLFVLIGILLHFDIVIMIYFFKCGKFFVVYGPLLVIMVVAFVGYGCKK